MQSEFMYEEFYGFKGTELVEMSRRTLVFRVYWRRMTTLLEKFSGELLVVFLEYLFGDFSGE